MDLISVASDVAVEGMVSNYKFEFGMLSSRR